MIALACRFGTIHRAHLQTLRRLRCSMRSSLLWFLLACAVSILLVNSVSAATRVPLVINEAFPDRAVPWPITTGVPFPRGALKNAENCRLVDEKGNVHRLQAKVAATWDAEQTS